MGEAKRRRELGFSPRGVKVPKIPRFAPGSKLEVNVQFLDVSGTHPEGFVVFACLSVNDKEYLRLGYKEPLSQDQKREIAHALMRKVQEDLTNINVPWNSDGVIQESSGKPKAEPS
jgi:hypothetical protein